jgi:hypothetical protein
MRTPPGCSQPDGDQRFVMISTAAEAAEIVLVLNWFEELESPRR